MNENQMRQLLQLAAARLHTTPEALRNAAESGALDPVAAGGETPAAQAVRQLLGDPEAARKLLETPAAQKLLQALAGGEKP